MLIPVNFELYPNICHLSNKIELNITLIVFDKVYKRWMKFEQYLSSMTDWPLTPFISELLVAWVDYNMPFVISKHR